MIWLRTALALTLALLWMPVSVHCQLEQLPALDFLSCCPHDLEVPHEDKDCEQDACAVVESGLYKTEDRHVCLPEPMLSDEFLPVTITFAPSLCVRPQVPVEASPHLSPTWQFILRTALPPRAPSLLS